MKKVTSVFLILFSASLNATFFSSSDLYQWLENDLNGNEIYQGGLGKGYLMGALDMLSGTIPKVVCYPPGISALKLKRVVFDYMRSNPDQMRNPVDKLVFQALTKEWPCK